MIPTYDQYIEPILRYLAQQPEGAAISDVRESVAATTGITSEERLQLLPSGGQPVYANRMGWAHDRLKRSGLSTSPRRGFWQLTDAGIAYVKSHPKPLTESEVEAIASANVDVPLSKKSDAAASATIVVAPTVQRESPDERIDHAIAELRQSVSRDLLEKIGQADPAFFERLVLELLHAMGYGRSEEDLQQVGGKGDEGIDGIISLDRLGLDRVYVQAKRYQGSVGPELIRGFLGALQLQGASRGVFLTTGTFTKQARESAAKARGTIVLVDGARLTDLMIEHGVGVTHETVRKPKVDGDYFEDA